MTTGTTFPNLSRSDIESLEIEWPNESARSSIADVLGALDDKIQANRRITTVADALWQTCLTEASTDGDHVPLSSLGRFVNGRAFTKAASGKGRMVIRIAELNSGPGSSTVYNDIPASAENTALPGDLLFAWSGSLVVQRWFRPEAIINQHIFKVIPGEGIPLWFLHGRIIELLPFYRSIAAGKATTMGHIQRHHLDELVLLPSASRLRELDRVCRPLWKSALAAESENLTLAELRDTLLPRLLSGELRVVEAA